MFLSNPMTCFGAASVLEKRIRSLRERRGVTKPWHRAAGEGQSATGVERTPATSATRRCSGQRKERERRPRGRRLDPVGLRLPRHGRQDQEAARQRRARHLLAAGRPPPFRLNATCSGKAVPAGGRRRNKLNKNVSKKKRKRSNQQQQRPETTSPR